MHRAFVIISDSLRQKIIISHAKVFDLFHNKTMHWCGIAKEFCFLTPLKFHY